MTTSTNTLPTVSANNKPLWAAVGFLGIAVLALGAGLVYVQNRPADGTTALVATAPKMETAPKTETEMAWSSRQDDLVAPPPPAVATVQPAPAKPVKPALVAASPVAKATVPAPAHAAHTRVAAAPAPRVARPTCANCGTIEAVTPITRNGSGSGVGTVAGGLVGAAVGNQIGKGDGRTVATILGAIGGGFAGNAIEKNVKKETVYQVRVQMEDGSTRNFEHTSMPSVGAKVVVEGSVLRYANGG